jgi:predicted permease
MRPGDEPIRRPSVEREVADELAFHFDMKVRELEARGLGASEARRQAEEGFGDLATVAAECRRIGHQRERRRRLVLFAAELGQDLRFALRLLWRRRAFAALAIVTMALGMGAATAIYSVVDGVLLRPLPFAEPGRLMAVWITQPSLADDPVLRWLAEGSVLGSDEYQALRGGNRSFQEVALWATGAARVQLPGDERATTRSVTRASASLLPVLRERPALGRGFLPGEDVFQGPKVAMISWELWHARFGDDPSVVGRTLQLDSVPYTVIGVLPPGLRLGRQSDPSALWIPALQEAYDRPEQHNRSFRVIGRLRDGVTPGVAQAEATVLLRAGSGDSTAGSRVQDWLHDQTRAARAPLLMVFAAAGLLLLIACVNVATLTLGESSARQHEVAARAALGAGRARLVRQLLTESVVIAILGAALGCGLAWALTRALLAGAPISLPGLDLAGINLRVLGVAALCATGTGMLFGLAPAWSLVRGGTGALLRTGAGQSARGARGLQRTLVAAETALSVMLLVGATLLARSLGKLGDVDPGFQPQGLKAIGLEMPSGFYSRGGQVMTAFYRRATERMRALPGVTAVAAGSATPFTGNNTSSPVAVEGVEYDEQNPPHTLQHSVLPGYLELLGVPLLAGRMLNESDGGGAELVALLNAAAVRRDFGGASALGRRVRYQGQWRRIVGVVGDMRLASLASEAGPAIYVPFAQHSYGTVSLVVRTALEPAALLAQSRRALAEVDPGVEVPAVNAMEELVSRSYAESRYRALLVSVFGLLALLLAAFGLYSVTARAAARRSREVGIRVALGATAGGVRRLLMGETFVGVALGALLGVPAALFAAGRMAPYLFGVGPGDAASYLAVLALLVVIAALASFLPARRASSASPARVLRAD